VIGRDVASGLKLLLEILLAIDDGHGGAGKDVRWTNEDRIADFVGESLGFGNAGKFLPCWLIDADTLEVGLSILHSDHIFGGNGICGFRGLSWELGIPKTALGITGGR
jgi:hypothetical protein